MTGKVTSSSLPMDSTNFLGDDIKPKNLQRRFTLQLFENVEDLPPYVGKAEEAMNQKRKFAAVDHMIAPDKLPIPEPKRATKQLVLTPQISSNIGIRPSNEDVHVVTEISYGTIFAVCDGHGQLIKERFNQSSRNRVLSSPKSSLTRSNKIFPTSFKPITTASRRPLTFGLKWSTKSCRHIRAHYTMQALQL